MKRWKLGCTLIVGDEIMLKNFTSIDEYGLRNKKNKQIEKWTSKRIIKYSVNRQVMKYRLQTRSVNKIANKELTLQSRPEYLIYVYTRIAVSKTNVYLFIMHVKCSQIVPQEIALIYWHFIILLSDLLVTFIVYHFLISSILLEGQITNINFNFILKHTHTRTHTDNY